MDKEQKKKLKAQFKHKEHEALLASIPMTIDDLKDLLTHLDREDVPDCDHTLKEATEFLIKRNLNPDKIIPWLNEHGGYCDCEVIYNVYEDVGDIVGWHLEEIKN